MSSPGHEREKNEAPPTCEKRMSDVSRFDLCGCWRGTELVATSGLPLRFGDLLMRRSVACPPPVVAAAGCVVEKLALSVPPPMGELDCWGSVVMESERGDTDDE